MKKLILIAALCSLSTACAASAPQSTVAFTIAAAPCPAPQKCLQALIAHTKVVGTIVFKNPDHYLHVSFVGVNPEFRANGIGTALLQAAETYTHCKTVRLTTLDSSLKFYEKLGFTCSSQGECTKPCDQSSLPKPAQTSKLGAQESKPKGDVS
jgi:predicted N-acetyltransferase YhbS